jgi:broad specificity phosphatase PhoE
VFEGLTRDQCATQYPEAWRDWLAQTSTPPGGELREAAVHRMNAALLAIGRTADSNVLVVSHGGVMRLWMMAQLGRVVPLVGNATSYVVEVGDGAMTVIDPPT